MVPVSEYDGTRSAQDVDDPLCSDKPEGLKARLAVLHCIEAERQPAQARKSHEGSRMERRYSLEKVVVSALAHRCIYLYNPQRSLKHVSQKETSRKQKK